MDIEAPSIKKIFNKKVVRSQEPEFRMNLGYVVDDLGGLSPLLNQKFSSLQLVAGQNPPLKDC
ncbi:hypothetical protein DP116_11375 [Brasilonema bromeliae SPC951]|uniref:Uncharacterized protein n=1 Tax=Brasilonema bromeliae SPC951 TaxID=385972 RepID=A0ABX1P8P0_9CYAN|nr:hypothetical protein [Brasilonema bromeliae SPC951]